MQTKAEDDEFISLTPYASIRIFFLLMDLFVMYNYKQGMTH